MIKLQWFDLCEASPPRMISCVTGQVTNQSEA